MKKFSLALFLLVPFLGMAESEEELADNNSDKSIEWGSNDSSPKTNPRWYRNPEARDAYLRGEKDFRGYPRQSNTNDGTDYYRK